MRTTQGYMLSW